MDGLEKKKKNTGKGKSICKARLAVRGFMEEWEKDAPICNDIYHCHEKMLMLFFGC